MALPREYVGYFASELVQRVEKAGKIRLKDKTAAAEKVQQVIASDIAREDALNQEVRQYLEQYNEQIRRDAISYQEMYKLVKKELLKKHKMVSSGRPDPEGARMSRDKVIDMSHQLLKGLAEAKAAVELLDEPNEVRLEIVRQMQSLLREENHMDQAVRQKIRSQKREITEGSEEWDILYKKYYAEEMRKLGVA